MEAKGGVVVVHTRLPPHGISSRIRVSKVFSELIRFDTLHLCISFPSSLEIVGPVDSLTIMNPLHEKHSVTSKITAAKMSKFQKFLYIFFTGKCGWHYT